MRNLRLKNVEAKIASLLQEIGKMFKIVATICQILWLKCRKIQFPLHGAPLQIPLVGELTALPQTP